MVTRKRSADARVHIDETRDAAYDETNLGEARIDKLTGGHVFSYVVGTAFNGKEMSEIRLLFPRSRHFRVTASPLDTPLVL